MSQKSDSECDQTTAAWTNTGEFTSSILLAQIREAPHVPQAHREAHLGQDILQFAVPGRASIIFWDLYLRHFFPSPPSYIQGAALVVQRLLVCEQVSH